GRFRRSPFAKLDRRGTMMQTDTGPLRVRMSMRDGDLFATAAFALLAAFAFVALPAGGWPRVVLALAVLLFAPGYLLLEAVTPTDADRRRALHAFLAIGVSPGLVGLLALTTAILPGGFRAGS